MVVGGKPGIVEPKTWAEQVAGALDWWRDAGVDLDYRDEAGNWLAKAAPAGDPAVEHPQSIAKPLEQNEGRPPRLTADASVAQIERAALPQDLPAFCNWWLSEPTLDGGIVSKRVPPRGPASPELMVIVPEPEEQDTDTLLTGPHGRLLAGILAGLGMAEEQVYFASALPRRMPLPDWSALRAAGLGQVLSHHIDLVAPTRVLLFGNNILSLMDNGSPQNPSFLPSVNHAGAGLPLWVELDLAAVLARPRSKAGLWNRLLDWMGSRVE
jgi:uracil-DNA glycosylase